MAKDNAKKTEAGTEAPASGEIEAAKDKIAKDNANKTEAGTEAPASGEIEAAKDKMTEDNAKMTEASTEAPASQTMRRGLTKMEERLAPSAYGHSPAVWCPCTRCVHESRQTFVLGVPLAEAHTAVVGTARALMAQAPPPPSAWPLDLRFSNQLMVVHKDAEDEVVLWHFTVRLSLRSDETFLCAVYRPRPCACSCSPANV